MGKTRTDALVKLKSTTSGQAQKYSEETILIISR